MATYCETAAIANKSELEKAPMVSRFGKLVLQRYAAPTLGSYSQLIAPLLERGLERDGLILAPYVLPLRSAAWWACLCVRQGLAAAPTGAEYWALRETVLWARTPTKEQSNRLRRFVQDCPRKTIPWYCARGAMLSGWAPPDMSTLEDCKPTLAARNLLAGVYLSLGSARRHGIAATTRQFVAFAEDVANQQVPWIPASKSQQ